MRSQNLKFFKPLYSRSKTFKSIDIAFDMKREGKLIASLNHSNGQSIPFIQGTLGQVIKEVEQMAAELGIPVNHPLTQPVITLANQYKFLRGQWVWHRRYADSFKNADEAYLELRALPLVVDGDALSTQQGDAKIVIDGSQHCTEKWKMIMYRFEHNGKCPISFKKAKTSCPRCFSLFVNESICLECGYE